MADAAGLLALRGRQFFGDDWVQAFGPARAGAEASLARLVDDLIARGPGLDEAAARRAVDECVRRLNDNNDGWVYTGEREAISDAIGEVVDRCGLDFREDWLGQRDW